MTRSNPTILIIDDDPNDLMFMRTAFTAVGATAKIQTVSGGEEAIAYLNGEGKYADRKMYGRPDFIITDLKMPGQDGFSVLEFLSQNSELASIPAAVFSGSQDDDDIRKARLLGACAYHVKPSSPHALRTMIRTLHDYWMICEVPAVDFDGRHLETDSRHKLGGRFSRRDP